MQSAHLSGLEPLFGDLRQIEKLYEVKSPLVSKLMRTHSSYISKYFVNGSQIWSLFSFLILHLMLNTERRLYKEVFF